MDIKIICELPGNLEVGHVTKIRRSPTGWAEVVRVIRKEYWSDERIEDEDEFRRVGWAGWWTKAEFRPAEEPADFAAERKAKEARLAKERKEAEEEKAEYEAAIEELGRAVSNRGRDETITTAYRDASGRCVAITHLGGYYATPDRIAFLAEKDRA